MLWPTLMRSFAKLTVLALICAVPALAGGQEATPPVTGEENAPAPEESAPVEDVTPAVTSTAAGGAFDHKTALDELNARADKLQGMISRANDRVLLLRESVILGAISPTRATIVHTDEMGSSFALQEVKYTLDGQTLLEAKPQSLDQQQREREIFNGPITPGPHELHVSLLYAGTGFGVFTYLKGYKLRVESRYKFTAAEGRLTKLTAISHAKKDITLEPKDRLAIRYELDVLTHSSAPPPGQR